MPLVLSTSKQSRELSTGLEYLNRITYVKVFRSSCYAMHTQCTQSQRSFVQTQGLFFVLFRGKKGTSRCGVKRCLSYKLVNPINTTVKGKGLFWVWSDRSIGDHLWTWSNLIDRTNVLVASPYQFSKDFQNWGTFWTGMQIKGPFLSIGPFSIGLMPFNFTTFDSCWSDWSYSKNKIIHRNRKKSDTYR